MKVETQRRGRKSPADTTNRSAAGDGTSRARDEGRVARRGSTRVEDQRPSGRWSRGSLATE